MYSLPVIHLFRVHRAVHLDLVDLEVRLVPIHLCLLLVQLDPLIQVVLVDRPHRVVLEIHRYRVCRPHHVHLRIVGKLSDFRISNYQTNWDLSKQVAYRLYIYKKYQMDYKISEG